MNRALPGMLVLAFYLRRSFLARLATTPNSETPNVKSSQQETMWLTLVPLMS